MKTTLAIRLAPWLATIALFVVWEAACRIFNIPPFFLHLELQPDGGDGGEHHQAGREVGEVPRRLLGPPCSRARARTVPPW